MKTYQLFDTMTLHCDSGSRHDFPRLARESGFAFNLYRGRVDWTKIGAIDVDRIVREKDLETLQDAISSVMSCSLSSEYDLKVLDPNFIKIFQLAQLGADFLLYCRNYLDHCVTVMQEQLRVALQEIEYLQKVKQQNTEELNALHKKLKARSKCNKSPTPCFKCPGCEKVFVGEQYLLAHQQRRHPGLLVTESIHNIQSKEVESLQQQVLELQARLHATEDALSRKQDPFIPDVNTLQAMLQSELQKMKSVPTNTLSSVAVPIRTEYLPPQHTQPIIASPEKIDISERSCTVLNTKTAKAENETNNNLPTITQSNSDLAPIPDPIQSTLLLSVEQQSNEIRELKQQLKIQNEAHESAMQRKLEELQRQHQADLDSLKLSIRNNRGSGDHLITSSHVVDGVTLIGSHHLSLPESEIPQAWDKGGSKTEGVLHEGSASSEGSKDEHHMSSKMVAPVVEDARPPNPREVHAIREEYVSPAEQDYSDSSSQNSSSSPVCPPQSGIKQKQVENQSLSMTENIKDSKTEESSTKMKSMYDKSGSSTSASETGSSSYDSESQSSNSDQEPSPHEREPRVQLTPQLLNGLKEDLMDLLNRRLRELGVDPEWDKLPVASFHSNMATVKHHQNIAAKSQKNYFSIQEALSKEVDKRVAERLKAQPSIPGSSRTKDKQASGSISIFARLKSHVKSRLSPGRSRHTVKYPTKPGTKTGELVENVYSEEPTHSKSLNEYEVLPEKLTLPAAVPESSLATPKTTDSGSSLPQNTATMSKSATSIADILHDESSDDKTTPGVIKTNVQVYGRSMYANLEKSDIEVPKKISDTPVRQPSQLKTSTPIKSDFKASLKPGERKPTFISSDVDSISEVESDLRDIMENTSEKTNENESEAPKTRPHTTLTTAELLANVAKFRQNSAQLSSQSIVKSNLKSSLSTGNIAKKKVVFRDEKDGFDTIELGPAHSSYESLAAQRSLSENSLIQTISSSPHSDQPVPLPRSNPVKPSTSVVNSDSDDDWDWDKDNSDTLTTKKSESEPTPTKRGLSFSDSKTSELTSFSLNDKPTDAGPEIRRVSDLVKDIEKSLKNPKDKPSFGIHVLGPKSLESSQISGFRSNSSSASSLTAHQSTRSFKEDKLSDLLLDDISSG